LFETPRDWERSVAAAAYASTPALICGGLLFMPLGGLCSAAGLI
jgi:hypothetical protein